MAIFAIGDMHLSLGTDKPMDVFPGWEGYLPRLEANWRKLICPEDTVVLAGDTSWAMNLNDTKADFAFIQNLPGQKWLLKGIVGDVALCGTRGWPFDDVAAQGEKLMAREAGRLRMSLQAAGEMREKIAFLHYPPIYPGAQAQELVDVLNEFHVTECCYGHLHGKSIRYAMQGEWDGITYRLISADGLSFCPYKIR